MKNSTLKFIISSSLCLIWTLILYLSFAFIAWQFNAGEWDAMGRFLCIMFWGLGMAVVVGIAIETK